MLDALRVAGIKLNSIEIHGFDRLASAAMSLNSANHYRDNKKVSSRHNWDAESALFNRWLNES